MSELTDPWAHLTTPCAPERPVTTTHHGVPLTDPYAWLRDPKYPTVEDPEIIAYLEAENSYLTQVLGSTGTLETDLFEELKGRIAKDDDSVPYQKGQYSYQRRYRQGGEYVLHARWKSDGERPENDVFLDENVLADGQDYLSVGALALSRDQQTLCYSVDFEGSERYELRFRDLATGGELPDRISNTQGTGVWSSDGAHFFYARLNEQLRPSRVYRHTLGTSPDDDTLVYEEQDPAFWLGIGESADDELIFIHCEDKETTEIRYLRADDPAGQFQLIYARREGHLYDVDFAAGWLYLRTNDTHRNYRLCRLRLGAALETAELLLAPSDEVYLRGVELFVDHLVVLEREGGLPQVRVRRLSDGAEHRIQFPDPAYTVRPIENVEYRTATLRLSYQSLVSPSSVLSYDLNNAALTVLKTQKIPSGYDASLYTSQRLTATAPDGARVPLSVVHRLDTPLDGSAPLYLYAYGSYGHSIDPYFSTNRLSLLDRGFVFVIAHVRGGSDLGRSWYDDGKLEKKQNTFTDTVAVAEFLIEQKYSRAGRLTLSGGSAGGLLVGAVINQRPELFHAAVLAVPFVDCLNTMLDGSLPLTPAEYSEWGNPETDPAAFATIKSYSPYDNIAPQPYPHIYVSAGISDPRVTYWEPAKWVAKLRATRTDRNLALLYTNMSAGHGGASGRFEALKDLAREYTALLLAYGHPDAEGE